MGKKKNAQPFRDEIRRLKEAARAAKDFIDPRALEELNYGALVLKKRVGAARRFFDKVNVLFSPKYARAPLMEAYISMAVAPHQGTRCIDDVYFPYLGAAVWLLDYFRERGLLPELISVLPSETPPMEAYGAPAVKDAFYSEALTSSVVSVIMERKEAHKENFESVVKMVDDKERRRLKKIYENHVFDFTGVFLAYATANEQQYDAGLKRILDNSERQWESAANDTWFAGDPAVMLETERLLNEKCVGESDFLCNAPYELNRSYEALKRKFGKFLAERLTEFGNGDPYELCAAYLFLTHEDDDLLYLTVPSAATLFYAVCRLPWNNGAGAQSAGSGAAAAAPIRYDLRYNNTADSSDTVGRNFQQLLFSINRQIMPRGLNYAETSPERFAGFDAPKDAVERLYNLSLVLELFEEKQKVPAPSNDDDDGGIIAGDEPEETFDDVRAQRDALLRKVKDTQAALEKERRAAAKVNRQCGERTERAAAEHEELISLREALFSIQRGEPEETAPPKIEFPYKTNGNICVFGGHDTWLKAIRPMLPDVAFINCDMRPHPDLIRNADVVWIQTNCMSHAYFEQIIGVVRQYNVRCRYFGYAGAQKCAEQIVNDAIGAA
jgi:hypothetical protein